VAFAITLHFKLGLFVWPAAVGRQQLCRHLSDAHTPSLGKNQLHSLWSVRILVVSQDFNG